ncbi:MAG: trypsin-like serine peptidase [Ruminococcus sp.]
MKEIKNKIISVFLSCTIAVSNCLAFSSLSVNAETDAAITYCKHRVGSSIRSFQKYNLSQDITDNTVSTYTIYGDVDHREPDNDNMAIVRLSVGGTGFIVDDHTIVTAAHCVISNEKRFSDDMTIDIVDSNNNVIKQVTPTAFHVPNDYRLGNPGNHDYAMIEVADDLSSYGYLSMGVVLDNYVDKAYSTTVKVSGFPQRDNEDWGQRYAGEGRITSLTKDTLYYTVDTSGGDSGGPVYSEFEASYGTEYKIVIGIHDGATGEMGKTNLILQLVLRQIYYSSI